MKRKLALFILILTILVGTMVTLQAGYIWSCYGRCSGCTCYGEAHKLSQCCGYCDIGGGFNVTCCFPDKCQAQPI